MQQALRERLADLAQVSRLKEVRDDRNLKQFELPFGSGLKKSQGQ
jgi:hypothetical protein